MKKLILGAVFLAIPTLAYSETKIYSEVLVGSSSQKTNSSYDSEGDELSHPEKSSFSEQISNSYAIRLGVKYTDYLSFELAMHNHGEVNYIHIFSRGYPISPIPEAPLLFRDEEAKASVQTESIRLGIKGELNIIENLSVNARLGVAKWKYDGLSPHVNGFTRGLDDGYDIYYSIGSKYNVSDALYIGLEYSLLTMQQDKEFDNSQRGTYEHEVKDLSVILGWVF
jgi:hypothetical protein